MVKFSTRLGRAKRSKKSLAARKRLEKSFKCEIVTKIIKTILERVENEKQSTQDCKKILNEVLEKVLTACESPTKIGESSKDPHGKTSSVLSDDEYDFFKDLRIEEIEM